MPDRGQDIGQLAILGPGVVDVVGHDDRQAEVVRERHRLGHEPVVVGEQVVRELDEEAAGRGRLPAPEERRVPLRDGARARPVAHPQAARELPVAAAGERDEALGVLGQQRLAEPRHRLRAGHVRSRDEPAQAPPPDRGPGEQHEMRAAAALADASQILLDRLAMTGQPLTLGPRPRGDALDDGIGEERCGILRPAGPSPGPARRHHDGARIRHGRVQQLDLQPDDRMQADGLGRPDEADRPVQPGMVGDGQPGQPQLDGPLDQVVRGRGPIEEREVGVAVEFGVGSGCHESLRSHGRLLGGWSV